jgi:hypothetical protein
MLKLRTENAKVCVTDMLRCVNTPCPQRQRVSRPVLPCPALYGLPHDQFFQHPFQFQELSDGGCKPAGVYLVYSVLNDGFKVFWLHVSVLRFWQWRSPRKTSLLLLCSA